jgi:MtrB/PioB family decaheme-associated outer membrane protein
MTMTRITRLVAILVSNVAVLSAPVFAQSAPPAATAAATPSSGAAAQDKDKDAAPSTDFQTGDVNLQLTARPDVGSSKFEEYRDVVRGVSVPAFRLFGSDGGIRFDLRGQNVKQLDERYTGYLKTDFFAVSADYNSIVHRIGNSGRTMLVQQSPGVWRMSPTLQQAFQNIWESTTNANRVFTTFVAPLFTPSIFEGNSVDVQVLRERTDITVDLAPNQPFSAKLNYRREQRHGSGGLSSNYISYQIETPSVTEYLTQDVGFNLAVNKPWGSVRGGLHYNWFVDQVPSLVFDNPFRATDALSVTVGTGAAATGVGGPASGRMINPPDNSAYLSQIGTTLKLPDHTRITADVNLGRLAQNAQFFPYSTNTAIVTPVVVAQTSSLPAQSLNGKIDTTSVVLAATSRPTEPLHLALRYRRYDVDNQTPRLTFPGYVSWDRTFSAGGRINVPYGYTNTRIDASADYDVGRLVTLEGAYRRNTIDRTFRETLQTAENAGSVALIMHVADMANLRAMYEKGSRDYSGLDLGRSEDASFVVPPTGPSANVLATDGNLRFDQARRDSNRAGIIFDISPGSMTSFAFTYLHNEDTYNETAHGLQNASYDTYTGEVTISPGEQWNVSAYYTREKNGSAQINNGTNNFPVIDDFTTQLQDTVDTAGVTGVFAISPTKATLNLGGRYQNLVGTASFITNPGSTYQLARSNTGGVQGIPNADNAKILRLDASVDYPLSPKMTLTVGAWYEDYQFSDVDSVGLQNIYPGAFFLALNDGSYHATVGYVRLGYRW